MRNKEPIPYDESTKNLGMLSGLLKRLRLSWLLLQDKQVPFWTKLVLPAAFLYLISPVDFIPALIFPVVGGLDDLGVVLLGIALFIKLAPQNIVENYLHNLEFGDLSDDDEVINTSYSVVDED